MAQRPTRRVTPLELRKIFNEDEYYERVQRNDLLASVESDRPCPSGAGQPPGSRSQMVAYFTPAMQRVALVHQYVLPDGALGGSGRPDPKRLLLEDVILYC